MRKIISLLLIVVLSLSYISVFHFSNVYADSNEEIVLEYEVRKTIYTEQPGEKSTFSFVAPESKRYYIYFFNGPVNYGIYDEETKTYEWSYNREEMYISLEAGETLTFKTKFVDEEKVGRLSVIVTDTYGKFYDIKATKIVEGTECEVIFTDSKGYMTFDFIPEESGWYKFYTTGKCNIKGTINNEEFKERLAESDNYVKDFLGFEQLSGNFKLIIYMEAGEQYYLCCSPTNTSGTYNAGVVKVPKATAMSIGKQEEINVQIGSDYTLKLYFTPEDCEGEVITWVSSNPDVVYIDENGDCHYKALGTSNVTATTESGLTDSIIINVVNPTEIKENVEVEQFGVSRDTIEYAFLPVKSGTYTFFVNITDPRISATIQIYDKEYNLIAESNKHFWSSDSIACSMKKGEYYYLTYSTYSDCIGSTATAKVYRTGDPAPADADPIDSADEVMQKGETLALEDVKGIKVGEEKQVNILYYDAKSVHKFIPEESGDYKFSAIGNDNIFFSVLNEKFKYISSGKTDFIMKLEAGKTYVIASHISSIDDDGLGEYSIKIDYPIYQAGDITKDGNINAEDALLALKAAAKIIELTAEESRLGDLNSDNLINAQDALEILKTAAKITE